METEGLLKMVIENREADARTSDRTSNARDRQLEPTIRKVYLQAIYQNLHLPPTQVASLIQTLGILLIYLWKQEGPPNLRTPSLTMST